MIKYEEYTNLGITDFAMRHFDPNFSGTKILNMTPEDFLDKLIHYILIESVTVKTGYADFVKIVMVRNFPKVPTGSMQINLENYQYLRSGYKARSDNELAVLTRWFELPIAPPEADSLGIVLYSKEQIEDEEHSRGHLDYNFHYKWGIVNISAQLGFEMEPMTPITMMRNALGKEEGGSGVELNRKEYEKSVKYWSTHAIIK